MSLPSQSDSPLCLRVSSSSFCRRGSSARTTTNRCVSIHPVVLNRLIVRSTCNPPVRLQSQFSIIGMSETMAQQSSLGWLPKRDYPEILDWRGFTWYDEFTCG